MAQLKTRSFADVAATGSSAAIKIADLESVYVQTFGTWTGTAIVQVSFDGGTTWADFDTATAVKVTAQLPPCTHARLNFTRTTGTLKGALGGNLRAA